MTLFHYLARSLRRPQTTPLPTRTSQCATAAHFPLHFKIPTSAPGKNSHQPVTAFRYCSRGHSVVASDLGKALLYDIIAPVVFVGARLATCGNTDSHRLLDLTTLGMNQSEQAQPWPQSDHIDMQDIDFANFLDIGDISNLDVSDFPSLDGPEVQQLGSNGASVHDFAADTFELSSALDGQNFAQGQTWSQQQIPQNIYRPPNHVPPTPNSFELQGHAAHYMPQQQMESTGGPFYDQHRHLTKEDNMAFTPLVSPAVTPRDSHFHPIPEYTIPGAYFSPLTSPALQAQQQQTRSYTHSQYSSAAASPLDLNIDADALKDKVGPIETAPRSRTRRKTQAPHSAGPAARVRQSPIVKAQRRRSTQHSSVIPPREVNNLLLEAQNQLQQGSRTPSTEYMAYNENTSAESISPEALPDCVMGPPPLPASAYHSPALQPQTHSAPASTTITSHNGAIGPCPATPASIMSIRKDQQINAANPSVQPPGSGQFQIQTQDQSAMLEDLTLPPAAAGPARPVLNRIVTSTSGEATPRLAPTPRGTPRLAASQSTTSSPAIGPTQSPALVPTPSFSGKKVDPKRSQSTKKRGSVGAASNLVSPAIRPKISPSIKPLLPDAGTCKKRNHTDCDNKMLIITK